VSFISSITIVLNWWKMVVSDWFFIMRWVEEAPLGNWHFFRDGVRCRESVATSVVSVWWQWLQYIFLQYLVCDRDKVIMDTTCWL